MSTATFAEFAERADYSLLEALTPDPESTADGEDHRPRQVLSGHYVPVTPTPIPEPQYLAHSRSLFSELGLSDDLAQDDQFRRMFSGDLGVATGPMRPWGWATGYALSIYGTEYTQQCPFGNGNGYGDGRAMSVFEGLFEGRRWEMQLKGGGPTPYCRGADGRAVLRSSVREFLAQDFMHALGVPTSRSLTLYVSHAETVRRPWYSENSRSIVWRQSGCQIFAIGFVRNIALRPTIGTVITRSIAAQLSIWLITWGKCSTSVPVTDLTN